MKLRSRLALTLVVLVVPFAIGIVSVQNNRARETAARTLTDALRERAEHGAVFRCERDPQTWPRRGRRGRGRMRPRPGRPGGLGKVFAYDALGASANPDAPAIDPAFAASIQADESAWEVERGVLRVGVFVGDFGACSMFVAEVPVHRLRTPLWPSLLIAGLAVLIAVLAAGPLVRRIRRLTEVVHAAGADGTLAVDERQDEIGELSRAFAADRERLRAQMAALRERDETLTEFVANTTHDVMIPLTVLQGHLIKLRDRLDPGGERDSAELALEEADYLGALMRNLGVAARLEAGQRPLEKVDVDLAQLIDRVVSRHRPIAKQSSVSLDYATPEGSSTIVADLTLVEQLVSNLVHNAVRYNESGGHVAVLMEMDEETFRVEVLDDGPGVAPADLARLGERRFRADAARSRQTHGSGLGLSIARDVAERHGFRLEFTANEPRGLRAILSGAKRPSMKRPAGRTSEESP